MASERNRTKPPPGYRIALDHPNREAAITDAWDAWDHWDRFGSPAAKLASAIRERDDLRVELRVTQGQREAAKGALAEARQERDEALAGKAEAWAAHAREWTRANDKKSQRDAERERSRRLVAALLEAFPAEEEDWAGATLRRVLAEHGEPRPAEPWQRKPVTHEWMWAHAEQGPTLYVVEALRHGYTVAPHVPGYGCPARRPVRGEP